MNFDFEGSRTCKLLALESQVVIEKHEEVDKSCLSSSHVKGNAPMHKAINAIWIFLASHRELDTTIGLELLNSVDAIGQAVRFEKLLQRSSDVHADGRPGVVIHLQERSVSCKGRSTEK